MAVIMRRRRILQAAVGLPAITALRGQAQKPDELPKLETIPADSFAEPVARFFTAAQFGALQKLADLILPSINGTPGALEARAPEFLDFLISQSPAERKALYRNGLDALAAKGVNEASLAPLRTKWTPVAQSEFLHVAKADIMTATVNSREWIAVVSQRNRNASGTSIYWHPVD
jgi:hypothetical protein